MEPLHTDKGQTGTQTGRQKLAFQGQRLLLEAANLLNGGNLIDALVHHLRAALVTDLVHLTLPIDFAKTLPAHLDSFLKVSGGAGKNARIRFVPQSMPEEGSWQAALKLSVVSLLHLGWSDWSVAKDLADFLRDVSLAEATSWKTDVEHIAGFDFNSFLYILTAIHENATRHQLFQEWIIPGRSEHAALLEDAEELVRLKPDRPLGYLQLGSYHSNHNNVQKAHEQYVKCIEVAEANDDEFFAATAGYQLMRVPKNGSQGPWFSKELLLQIHEQALQSYEKLKSWNPALARTIQDDAKHNKALVANADRLVTNAEGKICATQATMITPQQLERQMKMSHANGCEWCGKRVKQLRKCAACQQVAYCSKECQTTHWKQHKPLCKSSRGTRQG